MVPVLTQVTFRILRNVVRAQIGHAPITGGKRPFAELADIETPSQHSCLEGSQSSQGPGDAVLGRCGFLDGQRHVGEQAVNVAPDQTAGGRRVDVVLSAEEPIEIPAGNYR